MTIESILTAIDRAADAGEAVNAVPEHWPSFVMGPDERGEFSCSILPHGIAGPPKRVYDRGLAMGTGASRLEAMRAAVGWLRTRIPHDIRSGAAA